MPYSIIYAHSLLYNSYMFPLFCVAFFRELTPYPFGLRKNRYLYTKTNYYVNVYNFQTLLKNLFTAE